MAPSPPDSPPPSRPPDLGSPDLGSPSRPDASPAHRLPFLPPLPEVATRFGLLLRRLKVLHGTAPLQELDAETTLGLLHRCAANEDDHHALRTFTPLISRGFLGLLHHPPTKRRELAQTIALQVTVHPERLEQIASHIAPLVSVKPGSAIEALALSQANRRPVHRLAGSYSKNLWLGVIAFIGAAAAGLVLMAYGARRTLEERGKALAIPRSAALQAPTRVSAPAP